MIRPFLRLTGTVVCATIAAGAAFASQPITPSAIVDAAHTGSPEHRDENPPRFTTIAAALDAAPADRVGDYVIAIRDGRYREKLIVDKARIVLIGQSRDGTVIVNGSRSGQQAPDGHAMSTRDTATVTIRAPGFRAETLTIENDFDFPANDAKPKSDPTRIDTTQAVALMTDDGSDHAVFRNIRVTGYQDTLFVNAGRAYFQDCVVSGHIDFIFGAGQALFENCDVVTRARPAVVAGPIGYVTAPSTPIDRPWGLVFLDCRLLKEPGVRPGSSPLGRPWHPTADFPDGRYADPRAIGSAVFVRAWMDDHIPETGWDRMSGTGRAPGTKDWFEPESARFFERDSHGPGAHANPKRRLLTDAEAYAKDRLLGDWRP